MDTIYQPREDSFLLAEVVKKQAFGDVLDVGTGSGVQALTAAEKKEVNKVIACDINVDSVKYVKERIEKKSKDKKFLRKIEVVRSDLFSNLNQKFDVIIFNPPYLPEEKVEDEVAKVYNSGGKEGYEVIERFFGKVSNHLKKGGYILMVFSTLTNKKKVDEIIRNKRFSARLLKEYTLFYEKLFVYKVWK